MLFAVNFEKLHSIMQVLFILYEAEEINHFNVISYLCDSVNRVYL